MAQLLNTSERLLGLSDRAAKVGYKLFYARTGYKLTNDELEVGVKNIASLEVFLSKMEKLNRLEDAEKSTMETLSEELTGGVLPTLKLRPSR